jgi:hypothetical protein
LKATVPRLTSAGASKRGRGNHSDHISRWEGGAGGGGCSATFYFLQIELRRGKKELVTEIGLQGIREGEQGAGRREGSGKREKGGSWKREKQGTDRRKEL